MMYYSVAVTAVSMISCLVLLPLWIAFLQRYAYFQPIREDGPSQHKESKKHVPGMGGVVFVFLWLWISGCMVHKPQPLLWGLWLCAAAFFLLGVYDDVLKITQKNTYALGVKKKFFLQCLAALLPLLFLCYKGSAALILQQYLPYYGMLEFPLYVGLPLAVFVIVGSSNAVNLIDGLDGLASGVCLPILVGLSVCMPQFTQLDYPLAALMGVLLGYLWYNFKPAEIMMGDCGSLFLGAVMAYVALVSQHVFIFAIMGCMLVLTTLSVLLQVLYFKWTGGRRLFKMAPLHHHFELMAVPETTIVVRYILLTVFCVLLGVLCRLS